jgi:hypothetical protein
MSRIHVGKGSGAVIARGSDAGRGRRAVARVIPLVIALVATYALLVVVAMVTTSFNGRQLDFSVYYAAEAALRANPLANIYDPSVLASAARALPGCKFWPGAAYPYPPLLAVLMLPLGALPFDAAVHVWMLFNLALWAVDTALLVYWLRVLLSEGTAGAVGDGLSWRRRMANVMRGQADGPTMAAIGVVAVSVLAWPLLQGLLMGQVHVLLLFLLLCIPLCVRRNRPSLAGTLLALAIMIKVLPLLLLAYYLARGRWRLVLSAVAVSLFLLGATWLVVGAPTLFHAQAIFGSGYHFASSPDNLALAQAPVWLAAALGSHTAMLADGLGRGLIALIGILFAGGLVVVWHMARAAGDPRRLQNDTAAETTELLGYGWAICAMLLLSPLVWLHYYTLLLLPFVVCVGYVLRERRRMRMPKPGFLRTALVLLLVAGSLMYLPWSLGIDVSAIAAGPHLAGIALNPLLILLQPASVALLWCVAGWLVWRSVRGEAEPAVRSTHPASQQAPNETVSERVWYSE